jgi:hypothetical protein
MKQTVTVLNNQVEFLHFLKSKYPMFHLSNFFFRDLQYGLMEYLPKKRVAVNYAIAEMVAKEVAASFEKQNIFRRVNQQGWVVYYPEFAAKKGTA